MSRFRFRFDIHSKWNIHREDTAERSTNFARMDRATQTGDTQHHSTKDPLETRLASILHTKSRQINYSLRAISSQLQQIAHDMHEISDMLAWLSAPRNSDSTPTPDGEPGRPGLTQPQTPTGVTHQQLSLLADGTGLLLSLDSTSKTHKSGESHRQANHEQSSGQKSKEKETTWTEDSRL